MGGVMVRGGCGHGRSKGEYVAWESNGIKCEGLGVGHEGCDELKV